MNCPKCPDKHLKIIALGINPRIWTCVACGGVWVPDGKAAGLDPPPEISLLVQTGINMDGKAGLCPSGHGILTRARAPIGTTFYLDKCATCSGVWFDQGEWQMVSAAGFVSGLFELWSESWQRQQRKNAEEARYMNHLREQIGPELVGRLEEIADSLRSHPARDLALGFLHRRSRSRDA